MTCKDSRSLLECNCTFAEQLLSADLLDCMDVSLCPDDCPICGTCLSLIGCNVTGIPNFQLPEQSFGITMNVCILMTILVLLIILLLLYRVRRNQKGVTDDMTRGLIAGEFITGKDHDGTTSTNTNWEPPSGGPKDLFASQTSNSIACLKGDEKGPPNPFNGNIQQDKLEDSINEDVVVVDEVGPPNCLE